MGKKLETLTSKLRKGVAIGSIFVAPFFMGKANAQQPSLPSSQPTPWSQVGNFFQQPWSNSPNYGIDWDSLKTVEEKDSFLQNYLPKEFQKRQIQKYNGYSAVQFFINSKGLPNISNYDSNYDTAYNGNGNAPWVLVQGFDQSGNWILKGNAILEGNDPLRLSSWKIIDPSDSNKVADLSNCKYISINTEAYLPGGNFNYLTDMIKFELQEGSQIDTIMVSAPTWRNSPLTTTFSVNAPKDTTIPYRSNLDLTKENLGKVSVQTNLKLGPDFYFQGKEEYSSNKIKGEVYLKETSILEDTVYQGSSKDFNVKKKIIEELIEKNTLYNPAFPNGKPYEHTIKKDSVYQLIKVRETTPVENSKDTTPKNFEVSQNYPNPYNPSTTIEYQNNKYGDVKLNVYDILGRKLESRTQRGVFPGKHKFDINMEKYSSGVYIFEVSEGKKHKIIKGILQK